MSLRLYDQYGVSDERPENYKVIIAGLAGGPVTGSLSANFAFGGGNQYQSFADLAGDIPVIGKGIDLKNKLATGLRLAGRSAVTELETRKVWNSSEIPDFPIEMTLYQTSTDNESIMDKMRRINSAVYPTRNGAFFKAPLGYRFTGQNSRNAQGTVSLSIGTWFRALGLVVSNVSQNFTKEVNSNGHPIEITMTITFQPFRAITYDEWLQYFRD